MRKLLIAAAFGMGLAGHWSVEPARAFSEKETSTHVHDEIDRSRYLDADLSPNGSGGIHVHLVVSNGWRFAPLHAKALFGFYDPSGRLIERVEKFVWCQGSGGGHACERSYDFDVTSPWTAVDHVTLGGSYDLHPTYGPGPGPASMPTVPVIRRHY